MFPVQDIAMKVVAFTHQGPRAICILSATGAVSSVMFRQSSNPNGVVKYEVYKHCCMSLLTS